MKDIENLFEEKLKNHKVTPAPQSWDKLQQQMQGGTKKGMIPMYAWRAAAVILLLAGAFLARDAYVNEEKTQPAKNIAQQQHIESHQEDISNAEIAKDDLLQVSPQAVALPQTKEVQKAESSMQKTAAPVQQAASKQSSPQPVLALIPKVASQQAHRLSGVTDSQMITVSGPAFVVTSEKHQPVKIIYKGEAPGEVEHKDYRAFAFLDHLKTSGLSFSELRQAKDELVAKAFSTIND